jgi:hypothetical protein
VWRRSGNAVLPISYLYGPITSPKNELALSWLFCNRWNEETYFDVLFDGSTGIVPPSSVRTMWAGMASRRPAGTDRPEKRLTVAAD